MSVWREVAAEEGVSEPHRITDAGRPGGEGKKALMVDLFELFPPFIYRINDVK